MTCLLCVLVNKVNNTLNQSMSESFIDRKSPPLVDLLFLGSSTTSFLEVIESLLLLLCVLNKSIYMISGFTLVQNNFCE